MQPLPYPAEDRSQILVGDSLELLKTLAARSFRCCVTSPPHWGLRDYGVPGQIGAEEKLEDYVVNLTTVFREVRRVLSDDGTLWLNLGDSYTSGNRTWRDVDKKNPARGMDYRPPTPQGLKPKDLIGVPWRVAFALHTAGTCAPTSSGTNPMVSRNRSRTVLPDHTSTSFC